MATEAEVLQPQQLWLTYSLPAITKAGDPSEFPITGLGRIRESQSGSEQPPRLVPLYPVEDGLGSGGRA